MSKFVYGLLVTLFYSGLTMLVLSHCQIKELTKNQTPQVEWEVLNIEH